MSIDAEFYAKTKNLHDELRSAFEMHPKTADLTTVTIMSMNDSRDGQWILGAPEQDRQRIARRLRQCADMLEQKQ